MLDALSFPPWKNLDAEAKPDNGNAIWDPTPVWDSHTDTVWSVSVSLWHLLVVV